MTMSNFPNVSGIAIETTPGKQLTPEARKMLNDLTAELQKTGVKAIVGAFKCRGFMCGEFDTEAN
jgi:hypothetical protein